MSEIAGKQSPTDLQSARAAYLWDCLQDERWTLRKLEGRTGIKKGVISSRMRGATPLTMGEVETFAEVLHRDPVELFQTMLTPPSTSPTDSAPTMLDASKNAGKTRTTDYGYEDSVVRVDFGRRARVS